MSASYRLEYLFPFPRSPLFHSGKRLTMMRPRGDVEYDLSLAKSGLEDGDIWEMSSPKFRVI